MQTRMCAAYRGNCGGPCVTSIEFTLIATSVTAAAATAPAMVS